MPTPAPLWSRNFFLLWQGNAVSLLGTQVFHLTLMLWAKEVTGSTTVVGTLMMVGGLATFLAPLGGTLADRYDRSRVLVVLDLVSGALVLTLTAAFFLVPGRTTFLIGLLFAVSVLRGITASFFHATVHAVVPDLVSEEKLPAANSWLQSTFHVTQLLGQGAGGVLFRILGAPVLFLVDGVSYLLSALSESFIRLAPGPVREKTTRRAGLRRFVAETMEGFRYTMSHPGLRVFLVTAAAGNFLQASVMVLLPFFVSDFLGERVDWFGYLVAGFSLGTLTGVVTAGSVPIRGRWRAAILLSTITTVGLGRLALAFTQERFAALAIMVLTGLAAGLWVPNIGAILQMAVEPRMRGRVMGCIEAFRFGLVPVGMGFFGLLADLLDGDIPLIFAMCGAGLVAVCAWAATRPAFRALLSDREPPSPEHP